MGCDGVRNRFFPDAHIALDDGNELDLGLRGTGKAWLTRDRVQELASAFGVLMMMLDGIKARGKARRIEIG